MPGSPDPHKARSRLLHATKRFIEGARLERDRLAEREANAPRLLQGTPYEVINLTGLPTNDLDYYAYELARLQDAAKATIAALDSPPEVVRALEAFDASVPGLRAARNPLTHASDDARLDYVAWLGGIERLLPGSDVEILVDPREHHDAAEALASSLTEYLRSAIRK